MSNRLNEWRNEGFLVRLSYDEGTLYVTKTDFDRAFGAIVNASFEDVQRDFALSKQQLSRPNEWAVEGDVVRLSYDAGDLKVAKVDFDRAFGAIINAPYEAVRCEFAISEQPQKSIDEMITDAINKADAMQSAAEPKNVEKNYGEER